MHRSAVVPFALLLVATGCKTMSGSVPGWDDPVGPDVAAADTPEGATEPTDAVAEADDDGGDAGGTATETTDTAGDASDGGTEIAAKEDPPPKEPKPAKSEPAPLPKPKYGSIDKSCGKDAGVGQKLKSFKLATSDGKSVSNGTYRGRVLLVNFWGTWCKPCLKELPEFDQLYRRYRKNGMALLAIATDEDAAPVNEFKKKRKIAAKLAIGGEDYAGKYSSPQFPFTFVVDTEGTIKASYRGYKPKCMGKLEDDLRKELTKRAKARANK
jgi:peroxiredoxin